MTAWQARRLFYRHTSSAVWEEQPLCFACDLAARRGTLILLTPCVLPACLKYGSVAMAKHQYDDRNRRVPQALHSVAT